MYRTAAGEYSGELAENPSVTLYQVVYFALAVASFIMKPQNQDSSLKTQDFNVQNKNHSPNEEV